MSRTLVTQYAFSQRICRRFLVSLRRYRTMVIYIAADAAWLLKMTDFQSCRLHSLVLRCFQFFLIQRTPEIYILNFNLNPLRHHKPVWNSFWTGNNLLVCGMKWLTIKEILYSAWSWVTSQIIKKNKNSRNNSWN